MATAFGILTGIIGLVSFTQDNLETSGPSGATVSIMVGRDGINSDNYGGQIRRVDVFDAGNEYLGQQLLRNSAPAGGYISMTANQNVATIQAQYASITAGDDDICIAAVSLIQADASELGYGWLGDVGMECDVDGVGFAPNRQAVGNGEDGNVHFPFCTWLAENTPAWTVKFNGAGYIGEGNRNRDAFCANTLFGNFAGPIGQQPGARKRSVSQPIYERVRPRSMAEKLVVSTIRTHNMTELCSNPRMWSSDFIGVDGVYCDVGTHTAYPLCSHNNVEGCVVFDETSKVLSRKVGAGIAVAGSVLDSFHEYTTVEQWTEEVEAE